MEREALKLALEALKEIARHATTPYEDAWCGELADETLTAINALAQPAQEPASVTYKEVQDSMNSLEKGNLHQQAIAEELGQRKLYTTPPQRPWVGLTAEEAAECWTTSATQTWKNFEAKLKEKNT